MRGDYAFAEEQFQQFVALYPDDPQAPDATNWLGEALIQRGAYRRGGATCCSRLPEVPRRRRARPTCCSSSASRSPAPARRETACRTFVEVEQALSRPAAGLHAAAGRREGARRNARLSADRGRRRSGGAVRAARRIRTIGLAVSGGPDSLALMLLARAMRAIAEAAPRFIVYSVDHGLGPKRPARRRSWSREAEALGFPARVAALGRATSRRPASRQRRARPATG